MLACRDFCRCDIEFWILKEDPSLPAQSSEVVEAHRGRLTTAVAAMRISVWSTIDPVGWVVFRRFDHRLTHPDM